MFCFRQVYFLSVSPFLLLNLARRQSYAYAISLYTRPEIKSWRDVKFCAHAQCVLPRCCLNHTVQKGSGGVLGTSFRFGPTTEILENSQYGGSRVVENWQPKEPFYLQRSVIYGVVDEVSAVKAVINNLLRIIWIFLWCGRTVGRAVGRTVYGHVIAKFSGMVDALSYGAPPTRAWSSAVKDVIHKQSFKHNLNEQNNGKLVSLIGYT